MSTDRPVTDMPPHVLEYLREHNILTLATASPTGLPHAVTMVYVSDGLAIYFCTRPDTRTARHIEQNPAVSFTIDEYNPDWSKTKGIQGSGEGRVLLNADEIRHVVELFHKKFSFLSDQRTPNVSCFRITPSELHFIDNESTGGGQVGQAMGIDFRRDVVYNVFRALPPQEVETIAAKLDTMHVNAGQVVVRQGAPADKFFIIVDGEVEVVHEGDAGARSVASLKAGQFFGEIAILRDMPRTATVRAVTPTTLLAMDRDVFRALVAQSLATTEDFDRVIRQRLDDVAAGGTR